MENNSWVKLFRRFKKWEWYGNINMCRLFIHLLLTANYEDKKWQGILIKRGSLITSYGNLSKETGLTTQQVRYCLSKLKVTNEVTIKTTNKYTEVTINKYSDYQESNTQSNTQITNKEQTNNKQITTTKEYKNIKNIRSISKKPIKTYTEKKLTLEQVANGLTQAFNIHLKRNFKLSKGLLPNIEYWLDTYTPSEIESAIKNIKKDDFWHNKMTPTILFRKKNPQKEPVDYISQLLNLKEDSWTN